VKPVENNLSGIGFILVLFGVWRIREFASGTSSVFLVAVGCSIATVAYLIWFHFFSDHAKSAAERKTKISELPKSLIEKPSAGVLIGAELDLRIPIFLPDSIRTKHVHILGATGSGKTESVILNFLQQDVERGLGSIILDAKGDYSFIRTLKSVVPAEKLFIFDLSDSSSQAYNPLLIGSAEESAQRLFSSLTWSEEYYKSKAFSALLRIFKCHNQKHDRNPTIVEIAGYLATSDRFAAAVSDDDYPVSQGVQDFRDLGGLKDQVSSLTMGALASILAPKVDSIDLSTAQEGKVFYFRLQSLISPQIAQIVGKLVINHLNYICGTAHRKNNNAQPSKLVSIYLDEFATFACVEFGDLISKARSAGFALHFSHQSVGDLEGIAPGFLNRIADNSATKMVLRINDPESAEYFSRSFGTSIYQKTTYKVANVSSDEEGDFVGDGTVREAHQFRASPDLLKSHATGQGSVYVAHGEPSEFGSTSVFRIKFPPLKEGL
jgi:hypothetical protein